MLTISANFTRELRVSDHESSFSGFHGDVSETRIQRNKNSLMFEIRSCKTHASPGGTRMCSEGDGRE